MVQTTEQINQYFRYKFNPISKRISVACNRTPLHCAASCNSVHLCKLLVESGAAIFATTISDVETAADKCEEMENGYVQCSQFLYGERREDFTQALLSHLVFFIVISSCFSLRCAREVGGDE